MDSLLPSLRSLSMSGSQCGMGFVVDQQFRKLDSQERANLVMHDAELWGGVTVGNARERSRYAYY